MRPTNFADGLGMLRRQFLALGFMSLGGCASLFMKDEEEASIEDLLADTTKDTNVRLVGDVANAWGMTWLKVESVALVNGLAGTGSNPPAGPQRQALIDEMQTHRVPNPNELLASPSASLVLVRGYLPPGVRKEDRFDVEIRVPSRSETTSLRGGWLMLSRLRELEALGGVARQGHVIGLAEGNVIVDAAFNDGNEKVLETRGWVLGGGKSHLTRTLGLAMKTEHLSIQTSALVGAAINQRFQLMDGGKKGVANPKRESFVELTVHPTYRHNVARYMRVVRSIALKEQPAERAQRLKVLETRLNEPTSASQAAVQLEAIGRDAIPVLKRALTHSDQEVRFNAAEALAYLDDESAAAELGAAAKANPAFRSAALSALSTMKHINAFDALSELLHVPSAETRYGAFRALRTRNYLDPLVRGTVLGEDTFSYHVVSTSGEPMIHFTRTQRPEVTVFGTEQRMKPPAFLFGSRNIMLKAVDDEHIKVSNFQPGREDKHVVCTCEVTQIIPAIVQVGGGYVEVLQVIRAAKKEGYLDSRIAMEALPRMGRTYIREEQGADDDAEVTDATPEALAEPLSPRDDSRPDIFSRDKRAAEIDFNRDEQKSWWSSMRNMFSPKAE